MLQIGHLEVFVRDPAVAARDFYRDVLGFEVAQEQGSTPPV